jgi:hypothetical protein
VFVGPFGDGGDLLRVEEAGDEGDGDVHVLDGEVSGSLPRSAVN